MSNRCNLSCSYCFVAVNVGVERRLDFSQLCRAVDTFLCSSGPERRITFLGGEPLLQYPILLKTVEYIRKAGAANPISVNVFTNGTSLSPERLEALGANGVWTILSLDGAKETNDSNRSFTHSDRSVYEAVMERVRPLPKQRLGINMVFTSATVGALVRNIDMFYREGFRSIAFYPELYEVWNAAGLAELKRSLADFEVYYAALFDSTSEPFVVPSIPQMLARRTAASAGWWRECGNLILGADSNFHVCDKAMTFQLESIPDSALGSPREGVDWERRSARYAEAARFVDENRRPGAEFAVCPMGAYFHGGWSGEDPIAKLRNFELVSDVFSSAVLKVALRLQDSPRFQRAYRA